MQANEIQKQTQLTLDTYLTEHSDLKKALENGDTKAIDGVTYAIYHNLKSANDAAKQLGIGLENNTYMGFFEYLTEQKNKDRLIRYNPNIDFKKLTVMASDLIINPYTGDVFKKHMNIKV